MEAKTADVQPPLGGDIVQQLRQENAALRAELQALRSTTQLQTSPSTAHADRAQTFDFLGLPRELRDLVYEYFVVVGEVRIRDADVPQHHDMRYDHPKSARAEFSFFTVNKQIRLEALELYLSRNHFVVPYSLMWLHRGHFNHTIQYIGGRPSPDLLRGNLRSISVPFDFRSLAVEGNSEISTNFRADVALAEDVDCAIDLHHYLASDFCYKSCRTLVSIILNHRRLSRLQINLQNTTCRLGCHRLVVLMFSHVKESLQSWTSAVNATQIESLKFLGTVNDEERRAIRSAFPELLRSKITFRGRFSSFRRAWNPDVEMLDGTPSDQDLLVAYLGGSPSE